MVGACSSSKSFDKNLTFYNADNLKIELKEFSGVNLYAGNGRSDYGGIVLHPQMPGGMYTRSDIEIKKPIRAVYREFESDVGFKVQNIDAVENHQESIISKKGTLLALFENGRFRVIFFENVDGFTKQDLDRMFGVK